MELSGLSQTLIRSLANIRLPQMVCKLALYSTTWRHSKHIADKAEFLHTVHHLLYLNSVKYHCKYLLIRQCCEKVFGLFYFRFTLHTGTLFNAAIVYLHCCLLTSQMRSTIFQRSEMMNSHRLVANKKTDNKSSSVSFIKHQPSHTKSWLTFSISLMVTWRKKHITQLRECLYIHCHPCW